MSRAAVAEARERFEAVAVTADLSVLAEDLKAVLHLLDREHGLRRAVTDPARDADSKASLVRTLLDGKVSEAAVRLLAEVVGLRWSRPSELLDTIEKLAVNAEAAQAEAAGQLDELEDELFRFSRIIEAEPQLRAALASRRLPRQRKAELVGALLENKVTPSALRLITEVVTDPRGRSLERGLAEYDRLVAERRSRLIALVRTAVALSEEQRTRLASALSAAYGHDVHLNIELDPSVVGGLSIQLGDEIIDGTIAGRLDDVRRRLAI